MSTHEDGIAAAQKFSEETGVPWNDLRRVASIDLERQMREWLGPDHGEGIGSSDVSIHLSQMALDGSLFEKARPLVLLARVAKESGKPYEEVIENARRMFEPA